MGSETVTHATVYFTGHVQGVGFRYSVLQVAREYEVTGLARNLADGRVLVEVEGEAAEVDGFIGAVHDRMSGYIRRFDRTDAVRPRQLVGFTIR